MPIEAPVRIAKRPDPVTLTGKSAAKVADLIAQENDSSLFLRVAVTPGGCSGYSYEMFFDSELDDGDIVRDFEGIKVAVDPESAKLLSGSTLEYEDGLQGGFHLVNPNSTRTCGCGSSFS